MGKDTKKQGFLTQGVKENHGREHDRANATGVYVRSLILNKRAL